MRRAWLLILVLAIGLAIGSAATSADVYLPVPTEATFRAAFSPTRLPADEAKPISMALAERIGNQDGTHPPALQELRVDLDRHLGLSVKGLPRCGPLLHEAPTREDTLSQCEDAKVGTGLFKAEVAFPEQSPVEVASRIYVYNFGVRDGRITFLLYTLVPAPVTGVIVSRLEFRRSIHGPYGWKGVLTVPKIANGAGSITYLGARFRKGIFSASCPGGQLLTRAVSRFADGGRLQVADTHTC